MTNLAILELIRRRRRQLLVHRVLYYCYNTNLIEDSTYDKWNAELNSLEQQYPTIAEQVEFHDISPNRTVGSDDLSSYPMGIVRVAQWLLNYRGGDK